MLGEDDEENGKIPHREAHSVPAMGSHYESNCVPTPLERNDDGQSSHSRTLTTPHSLRVQDERSPSILRGSTKTSPAYQSSSSSFFPPFIALCLALNASARPPARLPPPVLLVLLGVALPLSPPDGVVRLTALSLAGVGGGSGFLPPAAGRFAGGAGGVGLAFAAGAFACLEMPLVVTVEWI